MLTSVVIGFALVLVVGIAILAFKIGFLKGYGYNLDKFIKKNEEHTKMLRQLRIGLADLREREDYKEHTDVLRRWMSSEELEKDIQEKK